MSSDRDGEPEGSSEQDDKETTDENLGRTVRSAVAEGGERLQRPLRQEFATGLTGGFDLAIGLIALLIVQDATGSHELGSLAFGIGFVILVLGHGELFTENFFVPVAGIVARKGAAVHLVRLWFTVLIANLVAGWIAVGLLLATRPDLDEAAAKVAEPYVHWGIGWQSFAGAVLAGIVITALTLLDRGSSSPTALVLAATGIAFVLAAPPLNHSVVGSVELFAALHAGASFGYADWLGVLGWASLGNLIGGVVIATSVQILQAGAGRVGAEEPEEPSTSS